MKRFKRIIGLFLAAIFILTAAPLEIKAEEPEEDNLKQALYIIPENFSDIDFFASNAYYTVPETVTVKEAEERLYDLIEKFEGKFFTVDGTYCDKGKVHATECDNCLMSNVIKAKWVEELVGMGKLDVSFCPTQYNYSGKQGSADGWQCFGFANFAHWYIFAQKNTDKVSSNLEFTGPMTYETLKNALPGDVIRSTLYGGHSMVFISCDENGFTVLDSNYSINYACQVKVHTVKYNSGYSVGVTGTKNYDRKTDAEKYLKGDIDFNGSVEIEDVYSARLAAAKLVVLSEEQVALGDVDGDGRITAVDANIIRRYIAKLIEKLS